MHREDNFGFLQKMLETIKQTSDAQDPDNTEMNKVQCIILRCVFHCSLVSVIRTYMQCVI